MRRLLLTVLTPAAFALLAGCGETASTPPAPAKKSVVQTAKKAPAAAAPKQIVTAAEKQPVKPAPSSTMPIIPTMPLPKGWQYVSENDLTKTPAGQSTQRALSSKL